MYMHIEYKDIVKQSLLLLDYTMNYNDNRFNASSINRKCTSGKVLEVLTAHCLEGKRKLSYCDLVIISSYERYTNNLHR